MWFDNPERPRRLTKEAENQRVTTTSLKMGGLIRKAGIPA
jgi:hypothetical protein